MREEIDKSTLKSFNRDGVIFTCLLLLTILSAVPLLVFLGTLGFVFFAVLSVITMYFALKVEKFKKRNDIQTFQEILSFREGKRLDEIEKAVEAGKHPYQKHSYNNHFALVLHTD